MSTYKQRLSKADALEEFDNQHGSVLDNALMVYAEHMRETAAQTQAAYDKIKDDPEARAAQDRTMVTTNGLFQMARAFTEAADRACAAREAWAELTGEDEL